MPGALARYLLDDHLRLDELLRRAVQPTGALDLGAFEDFRAGLLRHIGLEEKLLLPAARRARGAPLPVARQLRLEHGALAALLVPTPTAELLAEIRALLERHNPLEEGPAGVYASCEELLGPDEAAALLERARAAPPVPLAPHFDGPGTFRTAEAALSALAARSKKGDGG